jgi:hypothetical protein
LLIAGTAILSTIASATVTATTASAAVAAAFGSVVALRRGTWGVCRRVGLCVAAEQSLQPTNKPAGFLFRFGLGRTVRAGLIAAGFETSIVAPRLTRLERPLLGLVPRIAWLVGTLLARFAWSARIARIGVLAGFARLETAALSLALTLASTTLVLGLPLARFAAFTGRLKRWTLVRAWCGGFGGGSAGSAR